MDKDPEAEIEEFWNNLTKFLWKAIMIILLATMIVLFILNPITDKFLQR